MFNPENFRVVEPEDSNEDKKTIKEKSEEVRSLLHTLIIEGGVHPLDIFFLTEKVDFEQRNQRALLVFLSVLTVIRFFFVRGLRITLKLTSAVLQILIEEFEE